MVETQEEVWFVLLQGEELGPLSFEEVLDFYYKDMVTSESLLWRDGWSGWVPIVQIPEFSELLFQGVILKQPSQGQLGSLGEDTAFISTDHLDQISQLSQELAPTVVPSSMGFQLMESDFEELEELDDLEELNLDLSPQPTNPQSTNLPTSSTSSGGLKWVLIILVLSGAAWGGYLLKSPSSSLLPNNEGNESARARVNDSHNTRKDAPKASGGNGQQDTISDQGLANSEERGASDALPNKTRGAQDGGGGVAEITAAEITAAQTAAQAAAQAAVQTDSEPYIISDQGAFEELGDFTFSDLTDPTAEDELSGSDNQNEIKQSEVSTKGIRRRPSKRSKKRAGKNRARVNKKPNKKSNKRPKQKLNKLPNKDNKDVGSTSPLPQTISRGEFLRVIKANRPAFDRCVKLDPKLKGAVLSVRLVVKRNGAVSQAQATHRKLRKSPANACIIQAARSLKFPAYHGRLIRTQLPIRL